MIPASYLFKTVYDQHWVEPSHSEPDAHQPRSGLLKPILLLLLQKLHRRDRALHNLGARPLFH